MPPADAAVSLDAHHIGYAYVEKTDLHPARPRDLRTDLVGYAHRFYVSFAVAIVEDDFVPAEGIAISDCRVSDDGSWPGNNR